MRSAPLRSRTVLIAIGFTTAVGLLMFAYRYLDVVARGRSEPPTAKLVEELTSAFGILLLLPLVVWWVRRLRAARYAWAGWFAAHAVALVLFSIAHTTWNLAARTALFVMLSQGRYDYGDLPARYLMEFSIHVLLYGMLVAAITLVETRRAARERESRLARVEAELAEARVRALEARLQPHFLFNALNTVSSVMYDDPAAADTMLARLADLLRRTLRDADPEVALADELETLQLWLDVMRARFGDRLQVEMRIDEPVRTACVPPLLLQPLLENAVKHGGMTSNGRHSHVFVAARRAADVLQLEVHDDGPGLALPAEEAFSRGVGLSTTRQRLETLYGSRAAIALQSSPHGGLAVRISIPWRTASTHG